MYNHHSTDYKIAVVKYYLKSHQSMDYVCNIFNCSKQSLSRWIEQYKKEGSTKKHKRNSISYKIKRIHVLHALELLKSEIS